MATVFPFITKKIQHPVRKMRIAKQQLLSREYAIAMSHALRQPHRVTPPLEKNVTPRDRIVTSANIPYAWTFVTFVGRFYVGCCVQALLLPRWHQVFCREWLLLEGVVEHRCYWGALFTAIVLLFLPRLC